MSRRIVQIAVAAGDAEVMDTLYALADDGTAWWCFVDRRGFDEWMRVPDLPKGTADDGCCGFDDPSSTGAWCRGCPRFKDREAVASS